MEVIAIAALWLAFAATHMTLSSLKLRPRLVARLGERGFQGLYSLVALATFVPLCWIYATHKHAGPALWHLGGGEPARLLMYGGMSLVLILLVAGLTQPSPASLVPGRAEVRGAFRIARHPMFMAIGLWALLHLLVARVHAAELAFFGGFVLFALAGCRHQDQRKLASGDEPFRRFYEQTPFLPFTGSGALRGLREIPIPVVLGIAATFGILAVHARVFGGAP